MGNDKHGLIADVHQRNSITSDQDLSKTCLSGDTQCDKVNVVRFTHVIDSQWQINIFHLMR
ncbi:hypothetical protein D3C81_904490 [compost metagenome]